MVGGRGSKGLPSERLLCYCHQIGSSCLLLTRNPCMLYKNVMDAWKKFKKTRRIKSEDCPSSGQGNDLTESEFRWNTWHSYKYNNATEIHPTESTYVFFIKSEFYLLLFLYCVLCDGSTCCGICLCTLQQNIRYCSPSNHGCVGVQKQEVPACYMCKANSFSVLI